MLEESEEVLEVKKALEDKEGIEIKQIRLIYGGKNLSDANTLEASNVKAGETIHMIIQLR